MRLTQPLLLRSLLLLVGLTACGSDTQEEAGFFVAIESATGVLIRGDDLALVARVFQRRGPGDSVEVRNAEIVWVSDDPAIATVAVQSPGAALVTGVRSGSVAIRAYAPTFQAASSAALPLRVSELVEIDSVTPDTVRWGDMVTLHGVGVKSLFLTFLGNGAIELDTFSLSTAATGFDSARFWVPPPASTDTITAISPTLVVRAREQTLVLPFDRYEPNDRQPALISLDGPPPLARAPLFSFYNPALALEPPERDSIGVDWYRFRTSVPSRARTFFYTAPVVQGGEFAFLAAPSTNPTDSAATSWTVGAGLLTCKNRPFSVPQRPTDSLIVAFARLPGSDVDLISLYVGGARYGMAVVDAYVTADPAVGADRFEENDLCDFADQNFAQPALRIDALAGFADTLTIDNPNDVDWFRFAVGGGVPAVLTVRTGSRPLLVGDPRPDTSDIDLAVLTTVESSGQLTLIDRSRNAGSSESFTVTLQPGEYYLVVSDFTGAPTRYGLCMAAGLTCTLPPGTTSALRARERSDQRRPTLLRGLRR